MIAPGETSVSTGAGARGCYRTVGIDRLATWPVTSLAGKFCAPKNKEILKSDLTYRIHKYFQSHCLPAVAFLHIREEEQQR